jgi:type IV pilus assembly protein PilC
MPEFWCKMALPTGEIVERVMTAVDESVLRRDLDSKDCLLLDVRRRNPVFVALGETFRIRPRVHAREFLFFNQEFSALIRAGLPILASLDILIERRKNPVFKRALLDIRDRVKGGEALSEAFSAQGDLFPPLYSSSLASGERSGELPTVLKRYIDYTRNILAIRKKVTSALVYPAILMALSIVLIAIMVFYVIPNFSGFLSELGVDLPVITQIIMAASLALRDNLALIAGSLVAAVVGFLVWRRAGAGKIAVDRFKLRLPLLGSVAHDYAQNRFTRTLATLVSGGIPLVVSIELAARAVGNAFYEEEMLKVGGKVREGQALWESLEHSGLVSDIAVEMVKVGESTGALVEMLDNTSEFAEEEIDFRLNRLVTLIEPLMLIFMALVVTGMLLAFYLPLIRAAAGSRF